MSRRFLTLSLVIAAVIGGSGVTGASVAGAASRPAGDRGAAIASGAPGSQVDETITAVIAGLGVLVAVMCGVRIGVGHRSAARSRRTATSARRRLPPLAVHRRRWISGLAMVLAVAVGGSIILRSGPHGSGVPQQRELADNSDLGAAVPAGPLAELHGQASELLGTDVAFTVRLHTLRGYPVVVNAWASWCTPCRSEFSLFAGASAQYGRRVAFLGADTDDSAGDARAFLTQHPVGYPSYQTSESRLSRLAVLEGLPTTIYLNPAGKVVHVHVGQYGSQEALDQDISAYALAG
jgi:cytochrome c biogenesis protein CcmG, thiol:disulfide interchange protein DsbE